MIAAAAPVAEEAVAGRAAAGAAAKRGAGKAAARPRKVATPKPAAAGPAGGPPPPPSTEQMSADLLTPPSTKAAKNVGASVSDAFKSATLTPPKRLTARDTSGFAFGLVLYAIALASIRYGPAGAKGWLSAKFLNKPMTK